MVTGETGAGKTMIVTGIGLLLGDRAEARSVRSGTERAVVEGRLTVPDGPGTSRLAGRVRDAGGDLDDDELVVARHITAAGRSRAFLGGAQVPVSVCAEVTTELVAIHGQSEQIRLSAPGGSASCSTRTPARSWPVCWPTTGSAGPSTARPATELETLVAASAERAREVELLRFGLEQVEQVEPQPGEDLALAAESTRLQNADDLRLSVGGRAGRTLR